MRLRHLFAFAAALGPCAEPAAAQQRSRPASPDSWRHSAWACRGAVRPLEGTSAGTPLAGSSERNCADEQVSELIRADDVPAELRRRRSRASSTIELDVSPAGTATACTVTRASGEPRLDRLACSLVSSRARFRPLYAAPGRPIAARHDITAEWEVTDAPPPVMFYAPPMPVQTPVVDYTRRAWPRLDWWGPVDLVALPRIQESYPAGAPRGGVVGVDLLVRAATGIESCQVGVSSGNRALDEAACSVARTVELRYSRPCERCLDASVPLQVVWKREGGSHIRFPLPFPRLSPAPPMDPADTRRPDARRPLPEALPYVISVRDYRRIADRTMTDRRFVAELAIDAEGRPTSCRTRRSTGNQAIDARSCEIILRRARYRPQTDVFGDPAPTPSRAHRMDLPRSIRRRRRSAR
ncbi:MAG TPA: energy transducer TonB [Allosphingosinicella sp.]|jgi:TonB family protein